MFHFKRNFSLRESPSKPLTSSSPLKRIRLSSTILQSDEQSTILQLSSSLSDFKSRNLFTEKPETPPPTPSPPIERVETKIEKLKKKNDDLTNELGLLDEEIEAKFLSLKAKRETLVESKNKHFVVEDYIAAATRGQCVVRNLLNEIYNPGQELAMRVERIFEEAKKGHAKKFEKMYFELSNRMETTQNAINNKKKQLVHDLDLQKRTLMTIESRQSCHNPNSNSDKTTLQPIEEKSENDDDCVILESSVVQDVEATEDQDDEKTDISSQKDDEEDTSFTPCQAQRLE